MANLDFGRTPVVEPNQGKIFGTADTAVCFEQLFGDDVPLRRALAALQRGPFPFYRDNVVVFEDNLEDYLLFVVSGVGLPAIFLLEAAPIRRCYFSNGLVCFPLLLGMVGWPAFY